MKFTRCTLLCALFALCGWTQTTVAQTVIRGEIVDAKNGDPLIGASIVQKSDPSVGTVADFDGSFELKIKDALPTVVVCSYTGYGEKEITITDASNLKVELSDDAVTLDVVVEVVGQAVSEKQQAAPLTVESMGLAAIKAAPADNFYDALGSMKGVDMTAASLGFKIINTRGFNSTSPVRSLQLIDGVDNQSPGLNFSLGNFLGTSELDVLKVDLVVGASSAFYGPNAFNGVIAMTTKDPFYQKGLSASVKGGERNMADVAIRYADAIQNKDGKDVFGYKINASYLRADDWVADNYDPVFDDEFDPNVDIDPLTNLGGFDAVNIYGDEYNSNMDLSSLFVSGGDFAGIGEFYRTGYEELDLVDYDTRNLKTNLALHYRLNPDLEGDSPTLISSSSYSRGTTVYQGDNRFSLKNIAFFQTRLELNKRDKYFIRAYYTVSDGGDSYDPYATALKLQQRAKSNSDWAKDYINFWRNGDAFNGIPAPRDWMDENGYPQEELIFEPSPMLVFDKDAGAAWLNDEGNREMLAIFHQQAADFANQGGFFVPGSPEFEAQFNDIITSKNNFFDDGTRFFDESALYHVQGEYKFEPEWAEFIKVGASGRLYTPRTDGSVLADTLSMVTTDLGNGVIDTSFTRNPITNHEFGIYTGIEKKFLNDRLTGSVTMRMDKNENFDVLFSPAASLVWKPKPNNYFRVSFSSAIRNPTLGDQYLNLNVGRATLAGNLNGVEGLTTLESFDDFRQNGLDASFLETFDIAPVKPESVKTIEFGYRTTLFNSLYIDGSYYFSSYEDFLGFNIGLDIEFDNAGFPTSVRAFRYAANSINTVTTQGFSVGANYYFAKFFMVGGNYSWNRLNVEFEDDPIIPAFNTPEHKFNVSFSGKDMTIGGVSDVGFNINYKWIQGFLFEGSPQFTGFIPTYALVDAQINKQFKKINTTLKIGASNILNNEVFQAYGGPRIGRLAYASLVYEFKKR
jgi:outer membrane receptor protein involved in Fe transport